MIAEQIRMNRHRQLMSRSMQVQHSMKLRRNRSFRGDRARNTIRMKDHLSEPRAFEHVPVHFLVAARVAALSADGVGNDFAARFPIGRELQPATLQCEGPVNGVQCRAQREMNFALARIERQYQILRRDRS